MCKQHCGVAHGHVGVDWDVGTHNRTLYHSHRHNNKHSLLQYVARWVQLPSIEIATRTAQVVHYDLQRALTAT